MDRAPDYGSGGWGFDSLRARQLGTSCLVVSATSGRRGRPHPLAVRPTVVDAGRGDGDGERLRQDPHLDAQLVAHAGVDGVIGPRVAGQFSRPGVGVVQQRRASLGFINSGEGGAAAVSDPAGSTPDTRARVRLDPGNRKNASVMTLKAHTMIDILHLTCGRVAFRYDHSPHPGERIDPTHATLLDGTKPVVGDRMICGSCGKQALIEDLRPVHRRSSEST